MSEKFQDEIFISYAHIDNESPKSGLDGWITRFHSALEVRTAQVRGETPRIFATQSYRATTCSRMCWWIVCRKAG
jgi:hypothetical protein